MAIHLLRPTRESLHGKWSKDLQPALVVDPGDTVAYVDLLDVAWGHGQHDRVKQWRPKWADRQPSRDDGPAMHGPVYVRGARPGDTLVVRIDALVPGDYGWTWLGDTPFTRALNEAVGVSGEGRLLLWDLDGQALVGTSERGNRLALRPFFGTIGLCPAGDGWHEGWFPTAQGGNMDFAELVVGSTLYLPVAHEGGLLSVGDTHARQGDGELSGSAIECMAARAAVTVEVRRDFPVRTMTAETPNGWVTAGFGRDLDDATRQAVNGMLDLMERLLGCDRRDAMLLASAVVDVRITQLANGVRGVHARLHPEVLAPGARVASKVPPTPAAVRARGRLVRSLWGPNSGGGEDLYELDGRFWVLAYGDAEVGLPGGIREASDRERP